MESPLHRPSCRRLTSQNSSYDPPHQQLPVKPIRTTIDVLQAGRQRHPERAAAASATRERIRRRTRCRPGSLGAINLIYFIIARPKFPGTIYVDIAELSSSSWCFSGGKHKNRSTLEQDEEVVLELRAGSGRFSLFPRIFSQQEKWIWRTTLHHLLSDHRVVGGLGSGNCMWTTGWQRCFKIYRRVNQELMSFVCIIVHNPIIQWSDATGLVKNCDVPWSFVDGTFRVTLIFDVLSFRRARFITKISSVEEDVCE